MYRTSISGGLIRFPAFAMDLRRVFIQHILFFVVALAVLIFVAIFAIWYGTAEATKADINVNLGAGRPVPSDSPDNLLVFMQVSDLHISKYTPSRADNFVRFCSSIVKTVNPNFVIATGDLTDGRDDGDTMRGRPVRCFSRFRLRFTHHLLVRPSRFTFPLV